MPSKKQLTHNESRYSKNKSKMAACKSVLVLCPNARRQTVKVNPTTTVLQVLYCLHVFLQMHFKQTGKYRDLTTERRTWRVSEPSKKPLNQKKSGKFSSQPQKFKLHSIFESIHSNYPCEIV